MPVLSAVEEMAGCGVTPAPDPSRQGGGGYGKSPARTIRNCIKQVAAKSPSPLWGGVRGGGA